MQINVTHDLNKITKHLNALQRDVIPQAAARAMNRTIDSVHSAAAKTISAETGIKQNQVRKYLDKVRASRRVLQAEVIARRYTPNLIEFMSSAQVERSRRHKGDGVKAKAWGKQKEYPHTFVGRGRNSGKMLVMSRKSADRKAALKSIYGPSVPQTFIQRHVLSALVRLAQDRWRVNFDADLKYFLSRL